MQQNHKNHIPSPIIALITPIIPKKETSVLPSIEITEGAMKMEQKCACTDEMDGHLTTHNCKIYILILHLHQSSSNYVLICKITPRIQQYKTAFLSCLTTWSPTPLHMHCFTLNDPCTLAYLMLWLLKSCRTHKRLKYSNPVVSHHGN